MPARLKNTLIHTESCAIWSAFDQVQEIPYVLRGRHVDSSGNFGWISGQSVERLAQNEVVISYLWQGFSPLRKHNGFRDFTNLLHKYPHNPL